MALEILEQLKSGEAKFADVLAHIEEAYTHTPTKFSNGIHLNEAHENQGSAKVFAFAKIHNLSVEQTLSLFAEHYQNVLDTPTAQNHQNIRQFIENGWEGIQFEGVALTAK